MKIKDRINFMSNYLDCLYPNPKCELNFSNNIELLIAVMLSAQSTDKQVNKVTEKLFCKYKNIEDYLKVTTEEFAYDIKSIGLYNSKSKNIKKTIKIISKDYKGIVPNNIEELVKLPGVGRKTANVVINIGYNLPGLAVDTHVMRISKRLNLCFINDDAIKIEFKLKKIILKEYWGKRHLQLILFGRNICKAKQPLCNYCQLKPICSYYKRLFVNK